MFSDATFVVGFGVGDLIANFELGELSESGYDAEWCVLGASDVGEPHRRKRVWILAYSNRIRGLMLAKDQKVRHSRINCKISKLPSRSFGLSIPLELPIDNAICGIRRNDNGLAEGLEPSRAIGNGQVPRVAATAWRLLTQRIWNS